MFNQIRANEFFAYSALISPSGFKYEAQHGLKIHETPGTGF